MALSTEDVMTRHACSMVEEEDDDGFRESGWSL
jgi:hypothetical protein